MITGSVANKYPQRRHHIKVRSKLLNATGKVAKSKDVYAGNLISDKDLQTLSIQEIDNRLMNRFGRNDINTNILPNSSIPLMIVFGDLPEDLQEFTVEAISSSREPVS